MPDFEVIEHTADVGIRSNGRTRAESFQNAATGMFSLITDLEAVKERERFVIEATAADSEALLVEWLGELLYLFESRGVLLNRFEIVELSETHLRANAWGEPIDRARHELLSDIKAVTYHQLKVAQTDGSWKAEVIFDI